MKQKLKATIVILLAFILLTGPVMPAKAASGSIALSVSSSKVNIGDTVTVSVRAIGPEGESAVATMNISFDPNVLQFVSCNDVYGGGGNNISVATDSATITLKAVGAGTSSISVTGSDGVSMGNAGDLDSMQGSSASVTVNNAASNSIEGEGTAAPGTSEGNGTNTTEKLSGDNSLASLTISPGTLSPAFSGSRTKYTATVSEDVTSIAVNAKPANAKATVQSVSGNTDLQMGENTVNIVVKAENQTTATYTIVVTRKAQEAPEEETEEETETETETEEPIAAMIMVNDRNYAISQDFAAEEIPMDFSETTVNYQGVDYKGLKFDKGDLYLLYLKEETEEGAGAFFVYDTTRNIVYPFIQLTCGNGYIILLVPPVDAEIPQNYVETALELGDLGVITAYQRVVSDAEETDALEDATEMETEDPDAIGMLKKNFGNMIACGFGPMKVYAASEDLSVSDFYLVYAVNNEGTENWYQYDAAEMTYQRYSDGADGSQEDYDALLSNYNKLNDAYAAMKDKNEKLVIAIVIISAAAVIIILNLLLRRKSAAREDSDEDEDADNDVLYEDDMTEYGAAEDDGTEEYYDEDEEYYDEDEEYYDEDEEYYDEDEEYYDDDADDDADNDAGEYETVEEIETEETDEEYSEDTEAKPRKGKGRKKKNKQTEKEKTDENLEVMDLNDL